MSAKKSTSKLALAIVILLILGIVLMIFFIRFYTSYSKSLAPEGQATHSFLCRTNSLIRSYTPLSDFGQHFLVPQFLCDPPSIIINSKDCTCGIFTAPIEYSWQEYNEDPQKYAGCDFAICYKDCMGEGGNIARCDSSCTKKVGRDHCLYSEICAYESCIHEGGSHDACEKNKRYKLCSPLWTAEYVNYRLGSIASSCWHMGLEGKRNPGSIACYLGHVMFYPDLNTSTYCNQANSLCTSNWQLAPRSNCVPGNSICVNVAKNLGYCENNYYCRVTEDELISAAKKISAVRFSDGDDLTSEENTYVKYLPTNFKFINKTLDGSKSTNLHFLVSFVDDRFPEIDSLRKLFLTGIALSTGSDLVTLSALVIPIAYPEFKKDEVRMAVGN